MADPLDRAVGLRSPHDRFDSYIGYLFNVIVIQEERKQYVKSSQSNRSHTFVTC